MDLKSNPRPPDSLATNEKNAISTSPSSKCASKRSARQQNKKDCITASSNNIVSSDDPVCEIPKNESELQSRLSRGPHQPKLDPYPRTKIGSKLRSFQSDWFEKYKWLEYSSSKDAAFCFYCRFFSANDGHTNPAFIDKGFRNWHRANECFQNHQLSKSHVSSYSAWLLDEHRQAYLSKQEEIRHYNRNVMERMIDTVVCLTKKDVQNEEISNQSLFINFINMLGKYDPFMTKYVNNSFQNSDNLSIQIQNNLVIALHKVVRENMVSFIKGKLVSLIVEENTDCGHPKHLSVLVRYFDNRTHSPMEHFVSVHKLTTVDAQSIFNELNNILVDILKIDWSSVLSVCFDSASSVSSSGNNSQLVQLKCREKNHAILNVHCYTHCLNLILVDAIILSRENQIVFDFFGVIQTLYAFIEVDGDQHAVLGKISREVGAKLKTLKALSHVRWACRAEAVAAVKENHSVILSSLQDIVENTLMPDSKIKVRSLIHELSSFEFIFALHMMHPILQMLAKVSKALQTPDFNLLAAMIMVKSLQNSLYTMRNNPEYFKSIFYDSVKICEENNVSIRPPQKRQKTSMGNRIDHTVFATSSTPYQFDTREEQEKMVSFFPLIDSMISNIEQRFERESCKIVTAVGKLLNLDGDKDDVIVISERFRVSFEELKAEVALLRGYDGVPKGSSSNTVREWLDWLKEEDRFSMFPAFYKSIQYFSILPVTACSGSKITRVKQFLKNTKSQKCHLDSLITLNVERELLSAIDYGKVIDELKLFAPSEQEEDVNNLVII